MFWGRSKKMGVHLVGIGGSGMSGIAEVLLASDFRVTGSDLQMTAVTQRLIGLGAQIFFGHAATNVSDPAVVVISSAVRSENPEVQEAKRRQIPVIPRAEMLAELMRLKKGIAVAGSHGKTTTTSLLGQLIRSLDPTIVVGGRLQHWDASSVVGKGSAFVVEADESDRSFLKFSPVYSVVTNIDLEHLDNYRDLEDIKNTFLEFLNRTAFFGENWISFDCPNLRTIRSKITKPTKTFGFGEGADLRIIHSHFEKRQSFFSCVYEERTLGPFELSVVGNHNLMNAAAAIGLALRLGVGEATIAKRLKTFIPADRRLQIHGEGKSSEGEWAVVEDYAHHPTELTAALSGVKLLFPDHRVVAIFQPHRYSRTHALWTEFTECFSGRVDELYLLPVYAAHEKVIAGVTSENLLKEIKGVSKKVLLEKVPEFEALSLSRSQPTVFGVLGAGPLTKFAQSLAEYLKAH